VTYWHEHHKVNASGGMIHVAGYGFARDNGRPLSEIDYPNGAEINYASGAAVLYRLSALREVELLEEGFVMYHEDLELGLRLRLAGYKNVLCTKSLAYHDYSFSRNPKKFAWMELYRWLVILAYYRLWTLLLLLPLLLGIELGTWFMAVRGGWWQAKVWAYRQWLRPQTWTLLWRLRQRARRLRKISDQELLRLFTGKIEAQETNNVWMDRVINPAIDQAWQAAYKLIRW
jgi:GT2 family glycosyltransferase